MNMNEAKDLFLLSSCSKFIMAREYLPEYELYKKMNINKETENKWREIKLNEYFKYLDIANEQEIWITYSKMYDLVEMLRSNDALRIMMLSLDKISNKMCDDDRVIISEIIVGKKSKIARSGLIFLSYDLNNKEIAYFFSTYVLNYLKNNFNDDNLQKRSEKVRNLCNEIVAELNINSIK